MKSIRTPRPKNSTITAALSAAMVGWALASTAVTIDSSYSFGNVTPGSPSGMEDEVLRLEHLIKLFNGDSSKAPDAKVYTTTNGSNLPDQDLPAFSGDSTDQLGGGTKLGAQFKLDVSGWDYLLVKWANNTWYYYVAGLDAVTVVNDVQMNKTGRAYQGGSHYRLFRAEEQNVPSVPDGGPTLLLMAGGLLGLGVLLRRSY